MNDFKHKRESGNGSIDEVGELIRHVGAREAVARERLDRSHARVLQHWENVVAEQRASTRPRTMKNFAMAAGLVMVAGVAAVLWNQQGARQFETLATIDRVTGIVLASGMPLTSDSQILPGSPISTGEGGRVALRLVNGQSLRIDAFSRLRIDAADQLALQAGAVYIDSDSAGPQATIRVQTPLGVASDIGTRFQVRLKDESLIVGVADGLVEVVRDDGQSHSVDRGYALALDASGRHEKQELDASDPEWSWIESIVPEFDIEGATLEEYLAWYARERGLELEWSDSRSESNARNTGLSGSISGANLDEGLELVKRIAPFRHEIDEGRLRVSVE